MAWKRPENENVTYGNHYGIVPQPASSPAMEKLLIARLDALRVALVERATALSWEPDSVDKILEAGGLEPYTKQYEVEVEVVTKNTVRVRATAPDVAASLATTSGERLVNVREAP